METGYSWVGLLVEKGWLLECLGSVAFGGHHHHHRFRSKVERLQMRMEIRLGCRPPVKLSVLAAAEAKALGTRILCNMTTFPPTKCCLPLVVAMSRRLFMVEMISQSYSFTLIMSLANNNSTTTLEQQLWEKGQSRTGTRFTSQVSCR